jgi:hypothetical protein
MIGSNLEENNLYEKIPIFKFTIFKVNRPWASKTKPKN